MKRLLISFIMCLSAIVSFSQNKNTTLYIYRNDGMFNAFYYSEVDSMLCSMIDTTGVEHSEYIVQEIYTADSLYRIPLSAIDSISFATPKAEYQQNVKPINTSWLDYIISVEDLTITISKDIPSELMPIVGQVIVAETKEHPFEMGFAGRVSEIKNNGENYLVLCSDVTLKEIYKTLVYKGRSKSSQNSAQARAKRAENRNEMETVYFDIPHNLSLSLGPLSLNVSPIIALDYIICINDEQTYIDNRITHYYDCSAQLDCELTGENELVDMPLSFPIPTEVPGLRAEINVGTFFGYSGGITISMNKPFTVTGTTGYIAYDDHAADIDEWHFESKDTEFSANINGSVRFGMAAQARLAFITDRLASIDVTGYFGPEVTANFSLSSNGLLDGSLYSALKDSKITLNAYGAVKPGWRFAGFEHQELNYNPSFHFELNQWYILPEFNNLSWTQTQGTKGGKLDGGINRDLFWPGVQLGWSLYDRDEHMYASQYYPETYRLMNEWPWKGLEMELNDLPYGSKYTAYPMIRIWGYEMRALPSTEVKIDPLVSTGGVSDIGETSAVTSGYVEGLEYSMVADAGICYSTGDPISGSHVSSGSRADGAYSVPLSGLASNTTYFYAAYAYYDGEYYYGDTSSFKTKKKEDPDPDPDPNPDPDPDPIPVAITGSHYDETATSATIECTYENIPAGADCGYYLRGQKGGTIIGNISRSFGNVEGTKTVHLTDLKPAATYYYQAYAQYKGEEYLGAENSFQTSTPNAVTGDYSDVTSNKATIICSYYDVPSGATTGVKLSYNGQTDELPYSYGEGEHKIDVNNLYPGTSYTYSAYIKFENDYYEGSSKQFTTLTPGAYVGEATEIEEKTAQFEYGFSNVPSGGTCHIALQQEGGETYEYSVSDVEQDVFQLSGLQPSTTYTYWAYVDYYGETWNSNTGSFTTLAPPVPSAITGDASDITDKSANVECTFSNVPEGGVCGVEFTWNGGSTKQACGSSEGTITISLGGLKPNTTYTYCAYVEANGTTYYGEDKTFTTDLPDISGTWTCTEEYYRFTGAAPSYKTYSLTLNSDGGVSCSEYENIVSGSWSFRGDGTVTISIMTLATQTANAGVEWSGKVDSMSNPTKITGSTYNWNFNQIGYFQGDSHSIVMTK